MSVDRAKLEGAINRLKRRATACPVPVPQIDEDIWLACVVAEAHLATLPMAPLEDAYKAYWAAETPAQERAALGFIVAIKAVTDAPDGGYAFWLGRDACSVEAAA